MFKGIPLGNGTYVIIFVGIDAAEDLAHHQGVTAHLEDQNRQAGKAIWHF